MQVTLRRLAQYRLLLDPTPEQVRRTFVVFGQSRSGSTLLRSLLNAHPDVACDVELYRGFTPFPYHFHRAVRRRSTAPVWGFKLFVHHLDRDQGIAPRPFLASLHEQGYSILYLKRENVVRHALSQFLRRATGVTHQTRAAELPRVELDVDRYMEHLEMRVRYWRMADESIDGLPHLGIVYEADLQPPDARVRLMDRVFGELGVEPAPVASELKQINTKPLSEVIANYGELARRLDGTPHAKWLETA